MKDSTSFFFMKKNPMERWGLGNKLKEETWNSCWVRTLKLLSVQQQQRILENKRETASGVEHKFSIHIDNLPMSWLSSSLLSSPLLLAFTWSWAKTLCNLKSRSHTSFLSRANPYNSSIWGWPYHPVPIPHRPTSSLPLLSQLQLTPWPFSLPPSHMRKPNPGSINIAYSGPAPTWPNVGGNKQKLSRLLSR